MTLIVENSHKAVPDTRAPVMEQEMDLGNIRLIMLPPGELDLRLVMEVHTFDVSLGGGPLDLAMNSDRLAATSHPAQSISFQPIGTDFRVRCSNPLPECILEVDDETFCDWLQQGEIANDALLEARPWQRDLVAAELARASIQQLMRVSRSNVPADRLTVEALALGIAARGMAQFTTVDGDIDAEIRRWNRTAQRIDIERAIDMIEARLCESELSIADLADAACLSSSRFSSIFRSMLGESPYAFILRRRAEFARDLIIGTREPLSQIAYQAGFSSQAHMTVVIRKAFGVTPAAMRN